MDVLSDLLKVISLNQAVFFNVDLTAPWAIEFPATDELVQLLGRGGDRVMVYHYVTHGSCQLTTPEAGTLVLNKGDAAVLSHGQPYVLSSDGTTVASKVQLSGLLREPFSALRFGAGGEATQIVCGLLSCDAQCRSMLAALPGVLTLSFDRANGADRLTESVLGALIRATADEPGGRGIVAKLSEVLLLETIRRYVSGREGQQMGWFASLTDRVVGRCLALMHEKPAFPWTVDKLAREIGTSRSVLAERFTQLVGQAPKAYLTKWRMVVASNLLKRSSLSIMHIAAEVGYETDAAFSRAFRREFGVPPAYWRRSCGPSPEELSAAFARQLGSASDWESSTNRPAATRLQKPGFSPENTGPAPAGKNAGHEFGSSLSARQLAVTAGLAA